MNDDRQQNTTLNAQEILLKILTIIGVQDNKKELSDKLYNLSMQQALLDLVLSLPQDKKQAVTQVLSQEKSIEEINKLIQQYFTPQEYFEVVAKSTHKFFYEYIKTIKPTLTDEQRNNLDAYLNSLSSSQTP